MGLDSVEIILRAEELFAIDIGDEEAAKVETVGQFYELICSKLHIPPLQSPVTSEELPVITHREKVFLSLSRHTPLPAPADALPWSPQSVWDCVVAVFVDQLGLSTNDVTYHARIAKDLGVD
jgi:acyl carrier protein